MSADHRAVLESFYAANGPMADDATLERTFHPDYVSHTSPPDATPGMETALGLRAFLNAAYSDVRYRLLRTVVEGDYATAFTTCSGVYTGDTFGFPATNESFEAEQMHLMRFADDGRIVEHWGVRDDAGMMRQIRPAAVA